MRASSPFAWLSPRGVDGKLLIFMFHRVLERPDPLRPDEPDAELFERMVRFIGSYFRVLPLPDAAGALASGRLPSASACITFDDGYADNLTVAAPILQRHGATATVFVSTAFTSGARMWNDSVIEAVRAMPAGEVDWREFGLGVATVSDDRSRRELIGLVLRSLKYRDHAERSAIADEMALRARAPAGAGPMLTREQLREWRSLGFDVGGHTVSHPILSRLGDADAATEIAAGREQLMHLLGDAPAAFAYPNGAPGRDYRARDVALVRRAGFSCAVTTALGAGRRSTDPYQLPRMLPWDRSMWLFGLRCARTLTAGWRAVAVAPMQHDDQEVYP